MKNATILNRSISNISSDFRRNLPYIFFTANVFLVIAFYFTMAGMHEDGLIYSSLAANMSHNEGSLWDPSFSEALWPHFYEHPPLAFYLQSIFIRFVGDNPNIDKLYFFILTLISLGLLLLFWRQRFPQVRLHFVWVPILFWLANHENLAVGYHGRVESTLIIFTTLASYYILKGLSLSTKQAIYYYSLGSFLIMLAFFTNGCQAFFPLTIPVIYAFVFERHRRADVRWGWVSWKLVSITLLLSFLTIILIGMVLLYPPALNNTIHYFEQQVFATLSGSKSGQHSVGLFGHFKVLWFLCVNSIPAAIFTIYWCGVYSKQNKQPMLETIKSAFQNEWCLFFLFVALSSSLPVCFSPRQSNHYLAQSYPFWALFFIQACMPACANVINNKQNLALAPAKKQKFFLNGMVGLFLLLGMLNIHFAGRASYRNSPLLNDAEHLKKILPSHVNISVSNPHDFMVHHVFLFYRYHYICLTTQPNEAYYMQSKHEKTWPEGYLPVDAEFRTFQLFKKTKGYV